MNTTNECKRCGECCRIIAVSKAGMSHKFMMYLLTRGGRDTKTHILIDSQCPHLTKSNDCDLHDSKAMPELCRVYEGSGPFYVPTGCGYKSRGKARDVPT